MYNTLSVSKNSLREIAQQLQEAQEQQSVIEKIIVVGSPYIEA